MAVTLAVILLVVGLGPTVLQVLPPDIRQNIPFLMPQQAKKIVTVLVAQFDGPDSKNLRVTEELLAALQAEAHESGQVRVIALDQAITQAEGKEKAQELGKANNADIVIWGWYAKTTQAGRVSVNFEMLNPRSEELALQDSVQGKPRSLSAAALDRFEMQADLAKEMTYLTRVAVGTALYDAGNWDKAIQSLSAALQEVPAHEEMLLDPAIVRFYRANAYREKQQWNLAISDYDQAIALNPKLAAAFNNRGTAYSEKGEKDRAITDYNQAIALNPKLAAAFNNRGNDYAKKGEKDRAIVDYNQAITLNPKYAEAFNNRGTAYATKGEKDRAITDFSQAIKLNPKYAEPFSNRGLAYFEKGESDRAIADFNQAITLNPKLAEAFYNRGNAYSDKGEKDRAIDDYNQAITLNPKYAEAFYNRGNTYSDKGEKDRAIADFNRVIALNPKDTWAFFKRGLIYAEKEDYGRAILDYDQALSMKSEMLCRYCAFLHRGIAYAAKGKKDRAAADFREAIRNTQDPQLKKEAEDELKKLGAN